jgi:hypothetical protein
MMRRRVRVVPSPFLGFGGELVALVGLVGIVHAELHADDVALLEPRFVTIRLPADQTGVV